jgi:hypothetical protein
MVQRSRGGHPIQGACTAMEALRGAAENDQVTPAEFV